MQNIVLLCLALGLLGTLTACETVKGVGRDITNAGEALEEATK